MTNIGIPASNGRPLRDDDDDDDVIDIAEPIRDASDASSIPKSAPQTDDEEEAEGGGYQAARVTTVRPSLRPSPAPIDIAQPGPSRPRNRLATPISPGVGEESWQTASESFGGRSDESVVDSESPRWGNEGMTMRYPEPEPSITQVDGGAATLPPVRRASTTDLMTREPVEAVGGSERAGSSVVPPSFEATNSLASLLVHDRKRRGKAKDPLSPRFPIPLVKTSSFAQSKLNSRAQTMTPEAVEGPKVSTNTDRVTGGMVRFNTAVHLREHDQQLQLKLAELSRRRTLRRIGRQPKHRRRDGEIIKMENMLVRVEYVKKPLPENYDEHESQKYDLQTVERWREFIVVCREASGDNKPLCIQLYKSRTVPAVDRKHVSSRSTLTIRLIQGSTHVNLYSSLDKTLVLWHPLKSGTLIYTLRPRCASSSVEWFTFLCRVLDEWKRPEALQIVVPDLSVTVTIANPFDKVERKIVETDGQEEDGSLLREEKAIAGDLITRTMDTLRKCHQWDEILDNWWQGERVGLAWRKYDRLEWIHGVSIRLPSYPRIHLLK